MMNKILVFAGSNSSDSINHILAVCAAGLLKKSESTIIRLTEYPTPLYSKDLEAENGIPQNIVELNRLFNTHDGFIISLPEHNSSVTPIFKNMVDWISRHERPVFKDMPVLLMSTAPGKRGGITNLNYISEIMPWWGAKIAGKYSLPNFFENVDAKSSKFVNVEEKQKLEKVVDQFESSFNNLQ